MKSAVVTFLSVLVIGMVFGEMAVAQGPSTMNANIELARKNHEEVWSKGNLEAIPLIKETRLINARWDCLV
jgi:hypothetical protein